MSEEIKDNEQEQFMDNGSSFMKKPVIESSDDDDQPQTSNIKSQTKEMETHAHHLHHAPGKKFWHYLYEFIMLFLAIFCGFLAESYREHVVEKKREKEYMKEIVQNLRYDSIRCSLNSKTNLQLFLGLDSLRTELKRAIQGSVNSNAIYYFTLQYSGKTNQAVFNTSAITELKNSGSLRLIENKELVNELADYYERKITAAMSFLPTKNQVNDLQKTGNEFLSLADLDDYIGSYDDIQASTYSNNYDYRNILNRTPALHLLKADPVNLERLCTEISQFEIQLKNYNFWLGYVKNAAEKLIADIEKEYHLE